MIAVILLVLLVVPTVVWFTVRRPREDAGAPVETSGTKHRWWQP